MNAYKPPDTGGQIPPSRATSARRLCFVLFFIVAVGLLGFPLLKFLLMPSLNIPTPEDLSRYAFSLRLLAGILTLISISGIYFGFSALRVAKDARIRIVLTIVFFAVTSGTFTVLFWQAITRT